MNWYSIFYWLTVADGVKSIFDTLSNIFTVFTVVALIFYVGVLINRAVDKDKGETEESEELKSNRIWLKHFRAYFWISMILATFTWIAWAATPTKKDCLLIVAGGGAMNFLTTDSAAKHIPHEAMNYVVTELKTMAAEAKVDLGIQNQKDKVIEAAKQMTPDELISKIKSDSTFAKIVLDK